MQNKLSTEKITSDFFLDNKVLSIKNIYLFFLSFLGKKTSQIQYIYIVEFLTQHLKKCTTEGCKCSEYISLFNMEKRKDNYYNVIQKFISRGEKKISSIIVNQHSFLADTIQNYLFMYCNYLYSIQKNYYVCFYMCQYYLLKKKNELSFQDSYYLFELSYPSLKNIKKK